MLRNMIAIVVLFCTLLPTSAHAAQVFFGQFWDASGAVRNMSDADAIIAGGAPTATFTSTAIDYPNGSRDVTGSGNTTLVQFLGSDAGSIQGPSNATLTRSVFRWTGFIDLLPGLQDFTVMSGDGFRLTIGGNVVAEHFGQRGFGGTTGQVDAGTGRVSFELIYFENRGRTGVEFFIDNQLATPALVPLPAGFVLLISGMFGLLALRRRAVH